MFFYKSLLLVIVVIFQSFCLFGQESVQGATPIPDMSRSEPVYFVAVDELTASSFSADKKQPYRYHPWRTFDGDPFTAWKEGVKGPGIGENLTLKLAQYIMIDKIVILPGYFDPKWYSANNRVKECTFDFNGTREKCHLSDEMKPIAVFFSLPIRFKTMVFYIDAVYPGNKYNDTCVSEIQFFYKGKRVKLDSDDVLMDMDQNDGIPFWIDPEDMYSQGSSMSGSGETYFFKDGVYFHLYDNLGWSLAIKKGTWSRAPASNVITVSVNSIILVEGYGDYFSFPTGIRQYENYKISEKQVHEQSVLDWKEEIEWAGQELGGGSYFIDKITSQQYEDVREHFRDRAKNYKLSHEYYYTETKKRRAAGELY